MKSKRKFYLTLSFLITSIGILFASALMATSAWFGSIATHTPTWKAGSEGAYFAYGNGKPRVQGNDVDQPYGITKPIHIYNLAWLHYLGFLDTNDVDDEYGLDNLRFELGADIDMTGWTLPPIGTKDHPFVGLFDGQGHTISNLKISNSLNDYNRIPFGINRSDFPSKINIVGLFGVVGKYESQAIASYDTSANEIINTGITGLTVISKSDTTLAGLAAGYLNGKIEGVAVNNSNIDLSASGGSPISGITSNISDYSLIGYAKKDSSLTANDPNDKLGKIQLSNTKHITPSVSNPFLSQGGQEWGGSIEMDTMYNKLHTKLEASSYFSYSPTTRQYTRTDNNDGTYNPSSGYTLQSETPGNEVQLSSKIPNNGEYFYKYEDTGVNSQGQNVKTASYTFASDNAIGSLSTYKYVGLSGSPDKVLATYNDTNVYSTTIINGFKYYDTSTNQYLGVSNNSALIGTSSGSATVLFFDSGSHLYYIPNNNGNAKYYINVSGSTVSMSTAASTTWSWDDTNKALKTGSYYLINNGGWLLSTTTTTPAVTYYTISSGTNYLGVNGTTTAASVTQDNASAWYVENNPQYIYTLINGTKYYISLTTGSTGGCNSTTTYTYNLATTTNNTCLRRNGNALSATSSGTTYYLTIGSSLSGSTNSTNLTFTSTTVPAETKQNAREANGSATLQDQSINETKTVYENATYYPLTWAENSTVNPHPNNTGYVVAGHNYENTSNYSIGDIRIASYYTTSQLSNSFISGSNYSNSNLAVYTYDTDGNQTKIADPINQVTASTSGYTDYEALGFKKYYYDMLGQASGSRVSLGSSLGESGNNNIAYGLHFMNSDISTSRLINVPYVKINGEERTNYDLPQDSIDFHLKTGGFINFFAATYFVNTSNNSTNWNNSNNSFFSLHWIDRLSDGDDRTIDNIKQIAKIYKNTNYSDSNPSVPQYVYTYRNANDEEDENTFNTGLRDTNGTIITGSKGALVFDTYWLTDPEYSKFTLNALYYFEIPVNKGEFALGSTSGQTKRARGWGSNTTQYSKNGAYLLYLDIGASAKNTQGITINDSSTTTINKYLYPKGIDFKDITDFELADYQAITGGESAAIVIPENSQENINYIYTPATEGKALLSAGPTSNSTTIKIAYQTIGTDVKNKQNGELDIVDASSSLVDQMEREILYDLRNFNSGSAVTPTVTEIHTYKQTGQADKTATYVTDGEAITLTSQIISSIANIDPNGAILYEVNYSNILSDLTNEPGSDYVRITSTYDLFDREYTSAFASTAQNKKAEVIFINLSNLSQTYGTAPNTTSVTYHVIFTNLDEDGSAIGELSASDQNKLIIIICTQVSS